MAYASSALLNHDAREREAHLLCELVRLSPATVLLAEPGSDKSAFLENCVMPLLSAAQHPERSQVCVFFDAWGEEPLPALLAEIRRSIPVLDARRANQSEPSKSFAATLARWQHALDAMFVIVFDRFEEYLAAADQPGAAEFEGEFVTVMNTPELRAHFLIAVDEEAAPLLEALRARIPGFGDALIRLPRAPADAAMQVAETPPALESTQPLVGSPPPEEGSTRRFDEPRAPELRAPATFVGSTAKTHGLAANRVDIEPGLEDGERREPVLTKLAPEQSGQFGAAPPFEEPRAATEAPLQAPTGTPVRAPTRVPAAAWAVLGLLFVSVLGLLLSTIWQPAPRQPQSVDATAAPQPSDAAEAGLADAASLADDTPPPSPADDQVSLPEIAHEVPRASPARTRATKSASAPLPSASPGAAVYIHVRSEAQRAWAERLVQPLARRGIRVAGVRLVKSGPAHADLRYFRREEAAEAARVSRALREVGLPPLRLNRVPGFESRSTPRQYEVWLPPGNPTTSPSRGTAGRLSSQRTPYPARQS